MKERWTYSNGQRTAVFDVDIPDGCVIVSTGPCDVPRGPTYTLMKPGAAGPNWDWQPEIVTPKYDRLFLVKREAATDTPPSSPR